MSNNMKIIFLCSNPEFKNGEQYTSIVETCVSIEHAARYMEVLAHVVQAIDIADLSDVEDVTQQVADAAAQNRSDIQACYETMGEAAQ